MAKRIKVKRPYFEPDKAHKIVGDAIQRMAAEERQAWSATIEKPGLHVRRSPDVNSGEPYYQVVRAVSIDSGNGPCMRVEWTYGGGLLSAYQLSISQFQRIEE